MMQGSVQWLLDAGLPRDAYDSLDAVHVEDFSRVPGPAGINEARLLGRTLVTCSDAFLGRSELCIDHPGIVVIESKPVDGPSVTRNLLHLMFRLGQYDGTLVLSGSRFLLRNDRDVLQVLPDGRQIELEPWRQVRVRLAPAMAI